MPTTKPPPQFFQLNHVRASSSCFHSKAHPSKNKTTFNVSGDAEEVKSSVGLRLRLGLGLGLRLRLKRPGFDFSLTLNWNPFKGYQAFC